MYNNKVNYNNKNIIKTLTKVPEIMTISESSTQIYCRQPINFASCSSPRPNLMDLMGKNFQYIKHPKNVYAKFHTYLFVEFLCHINEYFKVLFQLILLVAQYKYDRHFMSHLVIKSKVHYAVTNYMQRALLFNSIMILGVGSLSIVHEQYYLL